VLLQSSSTRKHPTVFRRVLVVGVSILSFRLVKTTKPNHMIVLAGCWFGLFLLFNSIFPYNISLRFRQSRNRNDLVGSCAYDLLGRKTRNNAAFLFQPNRKSVFCLEFFSLFQPPSLWFVGLLLLFPGSAVSITFCTHDCHFIYNDRNDSLNFAFHTFLSGKAYSGGLLL
jgi:hypothetical protein